MRRHSDVLFIGGCADGEIISIDIDKVHVDIPKRQDYPRIVDDHTVPDSRVVSASHGYRIEKFAGEHRSFRYARWLGMHVDEVIEALLTHYKRVPE